MTLDEYVEFTISLGKIVARLRDKRGLNQSELASKCGASQSKLSRIENGIVIPDALMFKRLAEAFGMKPDDLYELVIIRKPII